MTDIVERVRGRARGYRLGGPKEMAALLEEAADEISRLRAEVERLREALFSLGAQASDIRVMLEPR